MSTRAVVAVPAGDSWRGRYVHWAGGPDTFGRTLARLVARDGVERVRQVLCEDYPGWSSVTGEESPTLHEDDGRFVVVPHYGVAYTLAQASMDEWLGPKDAAESWCVFAYVLAPTGRVQALGLVPEGSAEPWTYLGPVEV